VIVSESNAAGPAQALPGKTGSRKQLGPAQRDAGQDPWPLTLTLFHVDEGRLHESRAHWLEAM